MWTHFKQKSLRVQGLFLQVQGSELWKLSQTHAEELPKSQSQKDRGSLSTQVSSLHISFPGTEADPYLQPSASVRALGCEQNKWTLVNWSRKSG